MDLIPAQLRRGEILSLKNETIKIKAILADYEKEFQLLLSVIVALSNIWFNLENFTGQTNTLEN